ncbi:MAG: hypothetical protein IPK07_24500 [Deltaproteobacteria bacterium]|nr:hypothetical protein [Deltaproteobacteria bacterium]
MSTSRRVVSSSLVVALIAGIAACPTVPGSWSVLKTLGGPPSVSLAARAGAGVRERQRPHARGVDATGIVRYAERSKGAAWSLSKPVVLNAIGQFPVAAIGDDDTVAVAWVTVATEFTPAYVVATVRAPGGSFRRQRRWHSVPVSTT